MREGVVLGRFQPLHYGHVHLMRVACAENDSLVLCIGSAQENKPLNIEERKRRVLKQLEYEGISARVYTLEDPHPMVKWPSKLVETCELDEENTNTLYRADDDIPEDQMREMERVCLNLRLVKRITFPYRSPDGIYRLVRSATDIRNIHAALDGPL